MIEHLRWSYCFSFACMAEGHRLKDMWHRFIGKKALGFTNSDTRLLYAVSWVFTHVPRDSDTYSYVMGEPNEQADAPLYEAPLSDKTCFWAWWLTARNDGMSFWKAVSTGVHLGLIAKVQNRYAEPV